jgi:hypothetical protein
MINTPVRPGRGERVLNRSDEHGKQDRLPDNQSPGPCEQRDNHHDNCQSDDDQRELVVQSEVRILERSAVGGVEGAEPCKDELDDDGQERQPPEAPHGTSDASWHD